MKRKEASLLFYRQEAEADR